MIGFVKSTRYTLPHVNIFGIDYLIQIAKYGSSEQKNEIFEILKKRIPLNILHPLDDTLCLDRALTIPDGLKMYYEIQGTGQPVIVLHGGLETPSCLCQK